MMDRWNIKLKSWRLRDAYAPTFFSAEQYMPRYYFHIFDNMDSIDTEGMELPNWEAARIAAIRYAGSVLENEALRLKLGEDWRMEVTNDTGLILFRLDFCVTEAPVISREMKKLDEGGKRSAL